jgi:hypothetical protein
MGEKGIGRRIKKEDDVVWWDGGDTGARAKKVTKR